MRDGGPRFHEKFAAPVRENSPSVGRIDKGLFRSPSPPYNPPRQIRVGRRRHVTHSDEKAIKETRKPVKSQATQGTRVPARNGPPPPALQPAEELPLPDRGAIDLYPFYEMDFRLTIVFKTGKIYCYITATLFFLFFFWATISHKRKI